MDVFRVPGEASGQVKKYDLNVFAFPVYALDIPHVMAEYMKRLPKCEGGKAAVIAVHGSWNPRTMPGDAGCCLTRGAKILRGRGYDVFYADKVGYSVNWTFALNTPTPGDNEANRREGDRKVERIAENILSGDRNVRPAHAVYGLASRAFGMLFSLWGRQSVGLMYVADDHCNGCGACAGACPVKAIDMVGGVPTWNLRCEACQRCINGCPRAAIQTSIAKLILVLALELASALALILLFYLPYGSFFPDLAAGPIGTLYGPLLAFTLWLLIFVVYLVPLTRLAINVVGRVPGMNSMFKANFTGKYRRYIDPGFDTTETRAVKKRGPEGRKG